MTAEGDVELLRIEYNAAVQEVTHSQRKLDSAHRALVDAEGRYGLAVFELERGNFA